MDKKKILRVVLGSCSILLVPPFVFSCYFIIFFSFYYNAFINYPLQFAYICVIASTSAGIYCYNLSNKIGRK